MTRPRVLIWVAGGALAGLVGVGVGAVSARLGSPELFGLGVLLSIVAGVTIGGAIGRMDHEQGEGP